MTEIASDQLDPGQLAALQAVLAGEHAAVYAFGVVGGKLQGQPGEDVARASYERHTARRDQVTQVIVRADAEPEAAAVAYDTGPATTPAAARELAATVELALCGPYLDLVAVTEGRDRSAPARWACEAAAAAVDWGGQAMPFPGLADASGASG